MLCCSLAIHNRSCTADHPAKRAVRRSPDTAARSQRSPSPGPSPSPATRGAPSRQRADRPGSARTRLRPAPGPGRQRPASARSSATSSSASRAWHDADDDAADSGESQAEWETYVDGHTGMTYYHNPRCAVHTPTRTIACARTRPRHCTHATDSAIALRWVCSGPTPRSGSLHCTRPSLPVGFRRRQSRLPA